MIRKLVRTCFLLLLGGLLVLPALAGAGSGERLGLFSGQLVEQHGDVIGGDPIPGFVLRNGDRERALSPDQPQDLVGQPVTVEDTSNAAGLQGTAEAVSETRQLAAAATHPHTTAVVMVNFPGVRSTPFTQAEVKDRVFTGTTSANAFFQSQSDGDVALTGIADPTGDVFGWWQLDINQSTDCSALDLFWLGLAIDNKASSLGINLSGYNHVIVLFPHNAGCAWGGLGQMPGNISWINGYNVASIYAHELGHNMGVNHAASLNCGSSTLIVSTGDCTYTEYGDPQDVMGNGYALMSGWHRAQLGLLPSGAQATASASGRYVLSRLNQMTGAANPRMLLVPRRVGTNPVTQYFAVEWRSTFGLFDTFSVFPSDSAATIRLVPALSVVLQSQLLDTHPGGFSGFSDSGLQPGETFTDPLSGLRIHNSGLESGGLVLNVGRTSDGDTQAPTTAPVAHISYTNLGLYVGWTPAVDDWGIDHYELRRNGVAIATTPGTTREYYDNDLPPTEHVEYVVLAVDAGGNSVASAPVAQDVVDFHQPVMVTFSGARRPDGSAALTFSATDDRAVDHYVISWSGGQITATASPLIHVGAPAAATQYWISAVDAADNTSAVMGAYVPAVTPVTTTTTTTTRPPTTTTTTRSTTTTRPTTGTAPTDTTIPVTPTNEAATLAPAPAPHFVVRRVRGGRGGRLVITVSGASRVSLSAPGWHASTAAGRLSAAIPARVRAARRTRLQLRAVVDGATVRTTVTLHRGTVR